MVTVQNTAYMHARNILKPCIAFFAARGSFLLVFIHVSCFVISIIALAIKLISSLHSASQSVALLYS